MQQLLEKVLTDADAREDASLASLMGVVLTSTMQPWADEASPV